MQAVWSQLLAIAKEQIHVIVIAIAFVYFEYKQISSSKSNQSDDFFCSSRFA